MGTWNLKSAIGALAVSVCAHALLLCAACALLRGAGDVARAEADELPRLDVTSVDLSFSEEESEAAPPSVSQPGAPEAPPPPPEVSPPEIAAPLPITAPEEEAPTAEREVEEVRATELRPKDLEAPEPPPRTAAASAPSAPAPQQARVDAPPSPRRTIRPRYPEGARRRGEQGDVTLELEVDVHGIVVGVKVVAGCGFAELEQAAVSAVRKALFRPARRADKPVSSRARLTLTFRLKD